MDVFCVCMHIRVGIHTSFLFFIVFILIQGYEYMCICTYAYTQYSLTYSLHLLSMPPMLSFVKT